ncbi:MAG: tetratricopeptide repeat protein [Phycisphaerales bacterium]
MKFSHVVRSLAASVCLGGVLILSMSCSTAEGIKEDFTRLFGGDEAKEEYSDDSVTVMVEYDGEEIPVHVEPSNHPRSEAGVRALEVGDYDEAIEALEDAVDADDEDVRSIFALGVAYEATGDYDLAMDQYDAARELGDDRQYTQGYNRAKARLEGDG